MKVEHIVMVSILAVVIIIDFISKKRTKKNSVSDDILENVNESIVENKQSTRQSFIYSFVISIIISPIIYVLQDYFAYGALDDFEFYLELILFDEFDVFLIYFILSFSMVLLIFNNSFYFQYIKKRKKNISIFILSVLTLKVLINYFAYPVTFSKGGVGRFENGEPNYYRESNAHFGHYIDNIFSINLDLFWYAFSICVLIAWFFNDKIKAR